jgi:predicted SAM-dependent methyltransferase
MAKKIKIKKANSKRSKIKTRFPSPLRLDIGCGDNKVAGTFGIDFVKRNGVDMVVNLEKFPWPFASGSVTEVFCSHYIEHTKDLVKFMDEIHRILKPGGRLNLLAPYYASMRAWQDPTHTRAISEGTFLYFNKKWRELNHTDYYPIKSDFEFTYNFIFHEMWINRSDEARNFAIQHYNNVVTDIQVMLIKNAPEKKKGKKKAS